MEIAAQIPAPTIEEFADRGGPVRANGQGRFHPSSEQAHEL